MTKLRRDHIITASKYTEAEINLPSNTVHKDSSGTSPRHDDVSSEAGEVSSNLAPDESTREEHQETTGVRFRLVGL